MASGPLEPFSPGAGSGWIELLEGVRLTLIGVMLGELVDLTLTSSLETDETTRSVVFRCASASVKVFARPSTACGGHGWE